MVTSQDFAHRLTRVKEASKIEGKVIFPWLDLGVKGSTGLGSPEYQDMIRMNFLFLNIRIWLEWIFSRKLCCSCLKPGIRKANVESRMTLKFGDLVRKLSVSGSMKIILLANWLDSVSFLTLVTKQQSHLAFDQAALSYFSFSFLFFFQFSFFLPFLIPSICFG